MVIEGTFFLLFIRNMRLVHYHIISALSNLLAFLKNKTEGTVSSEQTWTFNPKSQKPLLSKKVIFFTKPGGGKLLATASIDVLWILYTNYPAPPRLCQALLGYWLSFLAVKGPCQKWWLQKISDYSSGILWCWPAMQETTMWCATLIKCKTQRCYRDTTSKLGGASMGEKKKRERKGQKK